MAPFIFPLSRPLWTDFTEFLFFVFTEFLVFVRFGGFFLFSCSTSGWLGSKRMNCVFIFLDHFFLCFDGGLVD